MIELLIAMAVIGILAALAIPTYKEFLNIAMRAEIKIHLNDMQKRLLAFRNDEGYFPPTGSLDALVVMGYLEKIANDPFTEDKDPSASPIPGFEVEEEGDWFYQHESGGPVIIYAHSNPAISYVITAGS
ncbi:MAG: hypothetical protein K8I02_01195 [Candidatus Methylomirabilis sp.]|nr:hypothetical protein [Deltaproteobacteria bacterium]